jgi:hypothetical protein
MIRSRISNRKLASFYRSLSIPLILLLAVFTFSCIALQTQPTSTTTTVTRPTTTTTRYITTTTTLPSQPQASTLHLIIVADTNDYKIGPSVSVDSRNMQSLFEAVVSRSNGKLFLNKIVFEGISVTQENMLGAIDSLRVRSDDVIVFLYAGHGHRYQSTSSKWPLMDTMNNPTDFLTVIQKIKSKSARQFIALADCCNTVIDVMYREPISAPRLSFPYENIKRMFLTSNVKIAASGSKPGQTSFGNNVDGGYFTSAFVANLSEALLNTGRTWAAVLENSRKNVLVKSDNKQEPQYEKSGE